MNLLQIKVIYTATENQNVKQSQLYFWLQCNTLRGKCPYLEFFWSVFSAIQTEYGEMLRIFPYSAQSGKTRTKTTPNTDTFQAVTLIFAQFKNWLK